MLSLQAATPGIGSEQLSSTWHSCRLGACVSGQAMLFVVQACFREALRLYPVAPVTLREAIEDTQLGSYKIPRGTGVHVNIYGLHHDAKLFPDAADFKPERFIDDPDLVRSKAYLPFGAGPHNCVGYVHVAPRQYVLRVHARQQSDPILYPCHVSLCTQVPLCFGRSACHAGEPIFKVYFPPL
jgi:Cytochrome P450